MSDQYPGQGGPPQYGQPQYGQGPYGQGPYGQGPYYGQPPQQYGQGPYYGQPPAYGGMPGVDGQLGRVRPTGLSMLLYFVTFGIYGIYYWYAVHEEMKRHSGQGLGGVVALILAIFVGIVMPYLTSHEVGEMQERTGRRRTVSGLTGLWYLPGMFILVGPFVWFVRTNGALNDYWRSQGARG